MDRNKLIGATIAGFLEHPITKEVSGIQITKDGQLMIINKEGKGDWTIADLKRIE